MLTTQDSKSILGPEQVQQLLVKPVTTEAVAARVSTVVNTSAHVTRFPILDTDPTAAWTAEAAEITPSDPTVNELVVVPSKIAGLVVCSNELVKDAINGSMNDIGAGLVRQIIAGTDAAFFGSLEAPAPAGLGSITASEITVAALDNLDWAEEARANAAAAGMELTGFVANPTDALTINTLKESTGSLRGLLQPDPTTPSTRLLAGVPLHTSPHVTAGTIWAVPAAASNLVVRDDSEVVADSSAFFTSDRLAIRATMRLGFAFTNEDAITKITVTS